MIFSIKKDGDNVRDQDNDDEDDGEIKKSN
jgi:hypothetical protein